MILDSNLTKRLLNGILGWGRGEGEGEARSSVLESNRPHDHDRAGSGVIALLAYLIALAAGLLDDHDHGVVEKKEEGCEIASGRGDSEREE